MNGLTINPWDEFYGPNIGYMLEQYEQYRQNPAAVNVEMRTFFEQNPPAESILQNIPASASSAAVAPDAVKITAAINLAQAIRWYGHWDSPLDPLGSPPPGDPALCMETYGLDEADLRAIPAYVIGGIAGVRTQTAWDAIQYLRKVYSGPVGHDYLQIRNAEERDWLREAAESGRFGVQQDPFDPVKLLQRLTDVEAFEHFLQRSFVAKTRFSIEGLDVLVPLLDVVIGSAAEAGIYHILIGMAHRGRLNILAYLLNKPIDQILAEFKDPLLRRVLQNEPDGWMGDVKYHAGASRTIDNDHDPNTINLTIQMAPNPSHLDRQVNRI
jgi:2-oxoglutarate dehydrogenase E1 component